MKKVFGLAILVGFALAAAADARVRQSVVSVLQGPQGPKGQPGPQGPPGVGNNVPLLYNGDAEVIVTGTSLDLASTIDLGTRGLDASQGGLLMTTSIVYGERTASGGGYCQLGWPQCGTILPHAYVSCGPGKIPISGHCRIAISGHTDLTLSQSCLSAGGSSCFGGPSGPVMASGGDYGWGCRAVNASICWGIA